jgi:hypothetical protein
VVFPFSGIFGEAALHYMPRETAHVIKFPERGQMRE